MRNRAILAAAGVLALAAAVPTSAQKPTPPGKQEVRLASSANPVVFRQPLTLSGSVKGVKAPLGVTLQRRSPTSTTWSDAATATTNAGGEFTFTPRPRRNVVYRVATRETTPRYSDELTQQVRPIVTLRVGDATPRAGQRVRFSGRVRPQHDGSRVEIQIRLPDSSWLTVARARLRDTGKPYSRYRRRVRVSATGTYRTILPAHADHAEGVSAERTLTVG